ncbi:MAG: low molecular weight phosphotyrosine protein phosphatase [Deltaproteobacteria bacterium]|nr:low molecular weight phosphotyrosine protein phosphatase [Deltaproteobacteria bacterium]
MSSAPERQSVLFVCLGNICRSPAAEGVFRDLVHREGAAARFVIESAGTGGWHLGELPDSRMRAAAARRGIQLESRARQVTLEDFRAFDHVLAMDASVHQELLRRCPPTSHGKVRLFRDLDPEGPGDVPDPYYGGPDGFEEVLDIVDRTGRAWFVAMTERKR